MDNISDVVKNIIEDLSKRQGKSQKSLYDVLNEIFDSKEKEHFSLVGENEGKVLLNVDSSAWAYHFTSKKTKILKEVKKQIPHIKSLSFKIGKVK